MVKQFGIIWVMSTVILIALTQFQSKTTLIPSNEQAALSAASTVLLPPRIVTCGEDLGELFMASLGQRDTFFINLRQGDLFRIQMRFREEGPGEQIDLYGPDGSLLSSITHTDPGAAVLQWPIDQLGVYTIVASAADNNTTGFYGISFQNDNQAGCATIMDCNAEATSFFPLAGIEAYSVQGSQNDTIRVQVQLVDPTATPKLQLFDPLGNLLLEQIGTAGELLSLSYEDLPQSGNYMILITEANGGEGGVFGISVQLIAQSCSIPVSCGAALTGSLSNWAGMEAYRLNASMGDDLLVQLGLDGAPPVLYLYQPDGQQLDSLIGTTGQVADLFFENLPMTGEYLIIATTRGTAPPGDFGISFQFLNESACSTPFLADDCEDSAFEQITEQAGVRVYDFDGEQGEFFAFQLEGSGNDFLGRLRIYDPNGNLIQEVRSEDGGSIQIVPFPLPTTGKYILVVDEWEGDYTGFFTLTGQSLGSDHEIDRTVKICLGESVFAGGQQQTEAGIYYDLAPQQGFCDAVYTTEIVLGDTVFVNVLEAVCFGDTFEYRGESYTETGIYEIVAPNPDGCDTLINLDILLVEPVESVIFDTICSGQIYGLGRNGYVESGNYTLTLCDTIVSLFLTVLPPLETNIDTSICFGQWVDVGTFRYSASGSYTNWLETAEGCDSIVNLNLEVYPLIETQIDSTICYGQFVDVGTFRYRESGNYSNMLETAEGCDSLVSLNLNVLPPIEQLIDTTICVGEFIEVNFARYRESINDTIYLETLENCDSLVILNLTVLDTALTRLDVTVCEGSTYRVGDTEYSQPGEYVQVFTGSTGCDSTVILDLEVSNIVFNDIQSELCQGAGFEINGTNYFETGFYTDTIITATGCDSIIRLDLMISDTFLIQIDTAVCPGSIIDVGENTYSASGFYIDTLNTVDGCDSIVWLQLEVLGEQFTIIDTSLCTGLAFDFGGMLLDESGLYRDTLVSSIGCDSLVELRLNMLPPPIANTQFSICQGESIVVNGISYDAPGSYQDTLQTSAGCDSILQFSLEVVSQLFTDLEVEVCEGETYLFDGNVLSTTGEYEATFTSIAGCDSIVSLSLTVFEVKNTQLVVSLCEGETYNVGDSTYSASGIYQNVLRTTENCDSVVNLDLTIVPRQENEVVAEICEGETYVLGTENYTVAGNYTQVLTGQAGCDSVVNLNLSVNPIPEINLTGETELCAGESTSLSIDDSYPIYSWSTGENTPIISVASTGTYTLSVTDDQGCVGTANLSVQVSMLNSDITPKIYPSGSLISCQGAADGALEALAFNGIAPYSWAWSTGSSTPMIDNLDPGTYVVTITDGFGCENIEEFTLTAPPEFSLSTSILPPLCIDEGGIVDVVVEGDTGPYTFQMGNTNQNIGLFEDVESGPHTITVADANGCEQLISIEVPQAEFLIEQSFEEVSITEGDSMPLLITANFPIDKIIWEPGRWLSCTDCPNPVAKPEASTVYRATVFSQSGCDLQAEFAIAVGPFNGFFISNGFSPNGDGINDTYFFQSDHRVANIQQVLIFDRWGKVLFERNDLLPNDSQLGWDGSYAGQPVPVGVYTYFVSIELQNGQTRTYKGGLTLLR